MILTKRNAAFRHEIEIRIYTLREDQNLFTVHTGFIHSMLLTIISGL